MADQNIVILIFTLRPGAVLWAAVFSNLPLNPPIARLLLSVYGKEDDIAPSSAFNRGIRVCRSTEEINSTYMAPPARIRTLIVDHETLARRRIRRFLTAESDLEVVGECGDPQKAVEFIRERGPDLVFLDVQMPGLDGFGVLESLPPRNLPEVVFVTAFDQYASRAFDVHALDYLLKPFGRPRFRQALEKVRVRFRRQEPALPDPRLNRLIETLGAKTRHAGRIVIKSAGRIILLRADEIDWVEAADNYVRVHAGPESHLLRETLGTLESRLDPAKFMRIHRSTIVNIDRVKELQPWFHGDYVAILENGSRLNLSRTYRDRVIAQLGEVF